MTDLISGSKISQFSQLLTAAKSPQSLVMTLMSQNPQMKALIDAAGGDPQKAFYSASQKRRIASEAKAAVPGPPALSMFSVNAPPLPYILPSWAKIRFVQV